MNHDVSIEMEDTWYTTPWKGHLIPPAGLDPQIENHCSRTWEVELYRKPRDGATHQDTGATSADSSENSQKVHKSDLDSRKIAKAF